MKHQLIPFTVKHKRYTPREYTFTHRFFWFLIDLDSADSWPSSLVSYNKRGAYSFFDSDHMDIGGVNARDNYILFAQQSGLATEVKSVQLLTQLRFLGYVFNPVSFVILTDIEDKKHFIIEIGNTFNELKPFFVHNKNLKNNIVSFKTVKNFYISPFIAHDNELDFKIKITDKKIVMYVDDTVSDNSVLKVWVNGNRIEASTFNLLKETLLVPFSTIKTIFLIHWHAFILWLMGIRFYKKGEYQELQQGTLIWKKSKSK
jgi:uncharacterized protein